MLSAIAAVDDSHGYFSARRRPSEAHSLTSVGCWSAYDSSDTLSLRSLEDSVSPSRRRSRPQHYTLVLYILSYSDSQCSQMRHFSVVLCLCFSSARIVSTAFSFCFYSLVWYLCVRVLGTSTLNLNFWMNFFCKMCMMFNRMKFWTLWQRIQFKLVCFTYLFWKPTKSCDVWCIFIVI